MKNATTATGTALVVIEHAVEDSRTPFTVSRPDAPFIAQLIATAAGVAQTRALRRATQPDALENYENVVARKIKALRLIGGRISLVA